MPVIRSLSLTAVLLAVTLACGGGGGGNGGITPPPPPPPPPPAPAPPSGSATVTMGASNFSPTQVTITRDGIVTWSNGSATLHNVTFAATSGAPSNIPDHSSGSNQRSFPTTGTFNYSCTNHGGMNGSVAVQ